MVNRRAGRVTGTRGAVLIPLVTVLVLSFAAFGTYRIGELNPFICDGPCSAQYVEPPEALGVTVKQQAVTPDVSAAGPASAAKVESAVRSSLTQPALGSRVGFVAIDPETGKVLAKKGTGTFTPASTTKVLTAFAALEAMDAGTRFVTRVVQDGDGSLVLVGGGDPFLTAKKPKPARYAHTANLTDLGKKTAAALKKSGTTAVSLGFDDSLFSGPDVSKRWERSYVPGNIVTPVSSLWADEGLSDGIRSPNPAASAASTFATILGKNGIDVKPPVTRVEAPADAAVIARVNSATLDQILESLIQRSDNQAAEVMLRHVAVAQGKPGTFDGGTAAVKGLLKAKGIDIDGLEMYDGSGLSRQNLMSPLTLAQTIRAAVNSPRAVSLVADLPIGGFNGTILDRFQVATSKDGRGVVRAKSGTLTGVHSLVGLVSDADGRPIIFAVMADRTGSAPPVEVKGAIDDVAAALADCHCGG